MLSAPAHASGTSTAVRLERRDDGHGDRTSWMIPPGRAVLIPAGTPHAIRMWGDVAMRSLYVPVGITTAAFAVDTCRVISVRPLLRELILRVAEMSALDSRVAAEARLMNVLMDELDAATIEPLLLPLPSDSRALTVAEAVLRNPAETPTAETLARAAGLGVRTLERLFRAETGMRFGMWRQKARLLESVRVLAEGRSVTDAALESGYSSVSAYIAAFKQDVRMHARLDAGRRDYRAHHKMNVAIATSRARSTGAQPPRAAGTD
jgi:AraC-like DNA-binding protein